MQIWKASFSSTLLINREIKLVNTLKYLIFQFRVSSQLPIEISSLEDWNLFNYQFAFSCLVISRQTRYWVAPVLDKLSLSWLTRCDLNMLELLCTLCATQIIGIGKNLVLLLSHTASGSQGNLPFTMRVKSERLSILSFLLQASPHAFTLISGIGAWKVFPQM